MFYYNCKNQLMQHICGNIIKTKNHFKSIQISGFSRWNIDPGRHSCSHLLSPPCDLCCSLSAVQQPCSIQRLPHLVSTAMGVKCCTLGHMDIF